jgi:hypothetical protein
LYFSKLLGKEELPVTILSEDPAIQEPVSQRRNGIEHQIKKYKSIQNVVKWLKDQPKHNLCQHKSSCIYYILKVNQVTIYLE